MNIIIDANNLAGYLGILSQIDFDQELIKLIEKFNQGKSRKIFLVFDSCELMGDFFEALNNVRVIYTPRDNYYRNADDMIVEIVQKSLEQTKNRCEVLVVTEDIELRQRIVNEHKEYGKKVFLEKSSEFKLRLFNRLNKKEIEDDVLTSLASEDEDDWDNYNNELLRIWK